MLSPVGLLNAVAAFGPVSRRPGLVFDPTSGRRLDLYAPSRVRSPLPTVVFLYGGGWDSGSRDMYPFVGTALARQGFLTLIPDYRVYPETRFPGFLEDAALAVRWAIDHASAFGGDPGRLVLVGHSAGAHIAAMLSFDRQWLARVGLEPDRRLRGFVGLAGPYDFLPLHSAVLRDILGVEPAVRKTQPIAFVDRRVVPTLLAAGAVDRVVDPANSTRLAARIADQGGEVATRVYPRVGHAALIGAFSPLLRWLAPVLADTTGFIRSVTATAPVAAATKTPALGQP